MNDILRYWPSFIGGVFFCAIFELVFRAVCDALKVWKQARNRQQALDRMAEDAREKGLTYEDGAQDDGKEGV